MNIESNTSANRAFPEREVHVWRVALHEMENSDADVFWCLSAAERARVERVRGESSARRFAVTRHALRHVLARYTGAAPAALELDVDARGKPAIRGAHDLHFSLSHAARLALIAVARTAVGIDIEHVREPRRLLRVAERVLHEHTVAELRRLPAEQRVVSFLDAWTQREAHVKAVGVGLLMTTDTLPADMSQPADGAVRLQRDRELGEAWSVARFIPAENARASVVARGEISRVRYFEWTAQPRELGDR